LADAKTFFDVLCLELDRSGNDEFLNRFNDLFALGLVVVGLTNKCGGRANVFEYVAEVAELVAVNKEVPT